MKKALMWSDAEACIVESANLLEATDASATPAANAIVKATGTGKLPLTWLDTTGASDGDIIKYVALTGTLEYDAGGGSGGGVVVREIDGTPSVSGVSVIEFSNGSVADIGAGVARVVFGGASGVASPVQKLTSLFYGDGTTTLFELPFTADEAYGVEIYTRTVEGVYRRVMSDEYDSVFGIGPDLTTTGTVSVSNAGNAALTIDNDLDTYVEFLYDEHPAYAMIDFGSGNAKAIRRIKAWTDVTNHTAHGRIQASHDDITWHTILYWSADPDYLWDRAIVWENVGAFRYWRLVIDWPGATYTSSFIYEIEMNEATSGTSGVQFITAPAVDERIEVTYFVAV